MRIWACLFLCLSILGCTTLSPTRGSLPTPVSPNEVLPIRQVRVVVLTPDEKKLPAIRELVRQASDNLSSQVGIGLKIVDWQPIVWQPADRAGLLRQVAYHMRLYYKPYDIVLAFHGFELATLAQYALFGAWEGVIDDTYRRFIIIRRMTVQVLLHEVCHGFLFSRFHSWGIRHLMTPLTLYIVPGIMPLNRSTYIQKRDREEILKNKWRDFSIAPNIPRSEAADTLDPEPSPPSADRQAQTVLTVSPPGR